MPELQRQIGFCLVCGNSVHGDEEFFKTDDGVCHRSCIEKRR